MASGAGEKPARRSKRGRSYEENAKLGPEKKRAGTVVVDFDLVYRRDPSKQGLRGSTGVKDLQETFFTKKQRLVDKEGKLIESTILEQTLWTTEEVEYLIMLRSQGDELFSQALKDKKLSRVWQTAAFGLSKDAKVGKSAKQCQWMWYMLMKEYNNVLDGRKTAEEFPFYLQMQETRKYRNQADGVGK